MRDVTIDEQTNYVKGEIFERGDSLKYCISAALLSKREIKAREKDIIIYKEILRSLERLKSLDGDVL